MGAAKTAAPPARGSDAFKAAVKAELSDHRVPMVFRVGDLGDQYNPWVLSAKIPVSAQVRLFKSDWMEETLTKMPPWIVPVLYVPAMLHCCVQSIGPTFGPGMLLWWAFFIAGLATWAHIEYALHRFVFHWATKNYWLNTLHFLLHGIHHLSPNDPERLVFPPVLAIPITLVIANSVRAYVGWSHGNAMVAGGIFGYMNYDMTHWFIHHRKPTSWLYSWLKRCHTHHHYRNHDVNFGISPAAKVLDFVFGTHVSPDW